MIELKHICKTFDSGGGEVEALKDVSLTIEKGEIYGIIGMSGAGKSTLVRCMNLLERPTSGEIWVDGQELEQMSAKDLRRARREITMIFQPFNLLLQRTWEACRIRPMPTRPSSPAASSSASPSPGLLPPIPRCCCAMKPPAPWTPTPPTRFSS